ncbi:MAG: hypothetical protein HZB55_13895 [Deltaproteobacteria bacterium]|nr:hypothetical protein [Deltaproteobacteria bacterium]
MRRLAEVVVSGKAQLLAWALILNHYRLVLRPRQMKLKDLMRRRMTGYAGWHNRRHGSSVGGSITGGSAEVGARPGADCEDVVSATCLFSSA